MATTLTEKNAINNNCRWFGFNFLKFHEQNLRQQTEKKFVSFEKKML